MAASGARTTGASDASTDDTSSATSGTASTPGTAFDSHDDVASPPPAPAPSATSADVAMQEDAGSMRIRESYRKSHDFGGWILWRFLVGGSCAVLGSQRTRRNDFADARSTSHLLP